MLLRNGWWLMVPPWSEPAGTGWGWGRTSEKTFFFFKSDLVKFRKNSKTLLNNYTYEGFGFKNDWHGLELVEHLCPLVCEPLPLLHSAPHSCCSPQVTVVVVCFSVSSISKIHFQGCQPLSFICQGLSVLGSHGLGGCVCVGEGGAPRQQWPELYTLQINTVVSCPVLYVRAETDWALLLRTCWRSGLVQLTFLWLWIKNKKEFF